MSRKDYKKLASILGRHRSGMNEATFTQLVDELCDWMKADNSRFDRVRFREAVSWDEVEGLIHD